MRHLRFPFAHPRLAAALPFAVLLTLIAAPVAADPPSGVTGAQQKANAAK
jgi:hypothetical protein